MAEAESLLEPPSEVGTFKKIMCCNRGEIAIRIFRCCHEMGLRTVAIYSHEDRISMHRYKADEAYEVTGPGVTPVGAYLDIDRIVKIAVDSNVDAIHPGYGFLSENAGFARAAAKAGVVFIGPTPDVIDAMGDKTKARTEAIAAGVSVVPGSDGAVAKFEDAEAFVLQHGFPVMIKAAMGGGGRGMRVVRDMSTFKESFERCQSEAKAAFGDGSVFLERYIEKPRHIEVQIIADHYGNVVHLYERDCSVQRRHQKVVEIAPAMHLKPSVRNAILNDAVKLCKHIGYRNAGTVEFLVDQQDRHYFIEVNPRIQVEHTITEEITGVDIVSTQILIAAGRSLPELGLSKPVEPRGHAIQCRVTTEDPSKGFAPDTGRIDVYRSSAGNGIRLDGSAGFTGSVITPYYDSLLVKVTGRAPTYRRAARKLVAALTEFRIRGVKTNIPFLQKLLTHPQFLDGYVTTDFLDTTPELFDFKISHNRAQKALHYLAHIHVNGPTVQGMSGSMGAVPGIPQSITGVADVNAPPPNGWRQVLLEKGPEGFAKAVRDHKGLLIMDTTWRDAHQSLLMTRMRTYDLANIAPHTAHAFSNAFALEMWGGATFDVALRFLHECPWARLKKLRQLVPNVPFQMLLRGANAVGYTSYPDNVVKEFVKAAKDAGVDIFRVFDSLNYFENLKLGIDAVREAGGVIEAVICYTGDVSDPGKTKYTLQYYLDFAQQLVDYGTHIIAIKDMAGLLKPRAATMLVGALRERFPHIPIHVHTHDTAGTGLASMLAAAEAGADVVDVAVDSMSGMTSQPSLGALLASVQGTKHDLHMDFKQLQDINNYWTEVRTLYQCFDPGLKFSGCSDVYLHEMPGGQYTNLQFQSMALGMSGQWDAIKKAYEQANRLMGDIIKVTPSSKVVGDMAQFMVQNNLDEEKVLSQAEKLSFPKSVVEFFQGYLGVPPGGFVEPLRSKIVKNLPLIEGRPGASLPPLDLAALGEKLRTKHGKWVSDLDVLSAALYPQVFEEYAAFRKEYGDVSMFPTKLLLGTMDGGEEISIDIEKGKRLYIKFIASSQAPGSAMRDVFFELNGEPRKVSIKDTTVAVEHEQRKKANPDHHGEVGAPMGGSVVEIRVQVGARVKEGDPIAVLNAMKMETVVAAPISGHVTSLDIRVGDSLAVGDLIAVIKKNTPAEIKKELARSMTDLLNDA
eukprot:Colp12_sorted_trinity150504_noHs@24512